MRVRTVSLYLLVCLCVEPALCQSLGAGRLRGVVRMADGSSPRAATVTLQATETVSAAQTLSVDGMGWFDVSRLPQATYNVTVSCRGYRSATQTADLRQGPTAFLSFTLESERSLSSSSALPPEGPGATLAANVSPAAQDALHEGQRRYQRGELREAVERFREALRLDASYAEAYLSLGMAYMDLQQWEEAERALAQVQELDPGRAEAYLAMGACLARRGRLDRARGMLGHGLELDPYSVRGHYEMAQVLWQQERWLEARQHAERAVTLEPRFARAQVLLGNICLRLRDGHGAIRAFKQYLRLQPEGELAEPTRRLMRRIEQAMATADAGP